MRDRENAHRHLQTRLRIAQLAAQLIAEHGLQDYAHAKRKAARQLGASEHHNLPSNEEIEAAIVEYHAIYDPAEHQQILRALRQEALEVMHALVQFQPLLVGSVLQGTVSRHSDIELELFADSSKDFELHLLNQGIAFKIKDRGDHALYLLSADPADVRVRILPSGQRHVAGKPPTDRASVAQLKQMLQDEGPTFR